MAWTKAKIATVAGLIILAVAGSATIIIHHFARHVPFSRMKFPRDEAFLRQLEKTPGYETTQEAVHFLHGLRINNRLPGVGANEQMELLTPDRLTNVENYPITRELQGRKRNATSTFPYHYLVVKASATSGWQLQRAWLVGPNGAVEELSIQ